MKKLWVVLLAATLCVAFSAPAVHAAEKKTKKTATKKTTARKKSSSKKKSSKKSHQAVQQVTQGQLAHLLVQVMGLSRFLPANPTDQQCFGILLDNSVVPADGWKSDKVVNKQDLARVIVQAMKKQGDIENPDDPKEWIDYLKGIGVPIDTVGETVYYVDPLAEPVVPNVVHAKTDPLTKRHMFDPIDETQYGVDMQAIVRVLSSFEFTDGEFRPLPVTPD